MEIEQFGCVLVEDNASLVLCPAAMRAVEHSNVPLCLTDVTSR